MPRQKSTTTKMWSSRIKSLTGFIKRNPVLIAGVVVLIALWPLVSFLFPTKWDNLDCFLPYRHFISFAFHSGEWPFWNPFQHLGYPAYSDMQNGMYNPVVWLLFLFGVYGPVALNAELVTYFLFAVWGTYKLSGLFVETRSAKVLASLSFTLSGFMLGTAQIMVFVAGAAFLPHVLYHLHLFLQRIELKQALYLALFGMLHITSASPSFTIVLGYIVLIMAAFQLVRVIKSKEWHTVKRIKRSALPVVILILSGAGMLAAYTVSVLEFWPYFSRTETLPYSGYLLANPFDFKNYVSFLAPLTTLANSEFFAGTDLTMRSGYFGVFPLFLFALSFRYWREFKVRALQVTFVVFLILAAGDATPVYRWFYELPGFGLFRHPAMFRAHFILAGALLAALSFERIVNTNSRLIPKLLLVVTLILVGVAAVSLVNPHIDDIKSVFSFSGLYSEPDKHFIKTYLLINSLVLLIIAGVCYIISVVYKVSLQKTVLIFITSEMLFYAFVTAPHTVYLSMPMNSFTQHFKNLPREFDQSCTETKYADLKQVYPPVTQGLWRNTATLHKSLTNDGSNPTQMKGYLQIEAGGGLQMTLQNPLFYDAREKADLPADTNFRGGVLWDFEAQPDFEVNSEKMKIKNPHYDFNTFSVEVENRSTKKDLLILNQNYHHLWIAGLNNRNTKVYRVNQTLMGVVIPAEFKGEVTFVFNSPALKITFILSVFTVLIVSGSIVYLEVKK